MRGTYVTSSQGVCVRGSRIRVAKHAAAVGDHNNSACLLKILTFATPKELLLLLDRFVDILILDRWGNTENMELRHNNERVNRSALPLLGKQGWAGIATENRQLRHPSGINSSGPRRAGDDRQAGRPRAYQSRLYIYCTLRCAVCTLRVRGEIMGLIIIRNF
eukprot:COSAG01_NODE_9597_length_2395_cov_27.035714_2_plen_162_part_00